MKKKVIKIIVLLFMVGFLTSATVIWLMSAFGTSPKIPSETLALINCNILKDYILKFYSEAGDRTSANVVSDFVTYVTAPEKKLMFSREPSVKPYISRRDMGFYLLLPEKLQSTRPVLIGYTDPVSNTKGELYRGVLFLRAQEIAVVILQEQVFKTIVGSEDFNHRKPDLYIWRQRLNYLLDQAKDIH